MNANELADKLLVASNNMEHNFHVSDWKLLFECALVMRNQQAKLECYERLADASEMASNPMSEKGREALKNVREMKTIMTKEEEEIRNAVEAEREACAKICDLAMLQNQEAINELEDIDINITWNENSMRDFGKDELNFARAILRKAQEK